MEGQFNYHDHNTPAKLRVIYNVSDITWTKWISQVPDPTLKKGQKVYTPQQVYNIISHLGEP